MILMNRAKLKVAVKFGPLTVRTDEYNLCDYLACPAAPGVHTYELGVDIPSATPRVRLTYRSQGRTVDGKQISCAEGAFSIQ